MGGKVVHEFQHLAKPNKARIFLTLDTQFQFFWLVGVVCLVIFGPRKELLLPVPYHFSRPQ